MQDGGPPLQILWVETRGLPVSLAAVPLAFRIPLKDNIGANDQGLRAARSGADDASARGGPDRAQTADASVRAAFAVLLRHRNPKAHI